MPKKKFKGKVGNGGSVSMQPTKKSWTIKIGKGGTASVSYKNTEYTDLPSPRFNPGRTGERHRMRGFRSGWNENVDEFGWPTSRGILGAARPNLGSQEYGGKTI